MTGQPDLFYPHTPGFKERGSTSQESAASMKGRAKTLRDGVLAALRFNPLTADEVAVLLRQSILSIRPRLSELRASGKIVPAGITRPNASGKQAKVWRAV